MGRDRDEGRRDAGRTASRESERSGDGLAGLRLSLALNRRRIQRAKEREATGGAVKIPDRGGRALDPGLRARMEPALGADLSGVRVFTGEESANAASKLGARAFTDDKNVHFAAGAFQPGTREGDRLIAHELAHTAQNGPGVKRDADPAAEGEAAATAETGAGEVAVSEPGDADEQSADAAADAATDKLHPAGGAGQAAAASAGGGAGGAAAAAPGGLPAPIGKVTTKTGVNVRAAPDKNGAKVSELPAGTTLDVYGISKSWLAVLPQGTSTFFITGGSEFVDFQKLPPPPDPAPAAPPAAEAPAAAPAEEEGGGGGGFFSAVGNMVGSAVQGVKDTVSGAVSGAVDAAAGMVQSAADFFGFGDETEPAEHTPEELEQLKEEAAEQAPAEQAAAGPVFFSQRDNEFGKDGAETIDNNTNVIPDKECNVTSLAMQLVTLAGSIEAVNTETIAKLKAAGAATTPEMMQAQPEDLILKLFQVRGEAYWQEVCNANPDFFPLMNNNPRTTFFQFYKDRSCGWHQVANCLAWVGQEYSFTKNTGGKQKGGGGGYDEKLADGSHDTTSQKYYQEVLKPKLDAGAAIMVSTDLASGHVCVLAGIEEDGVRIHDPYGMHVPGKNSHLKNNDASAKKKAAWFEEDPDGIAGRLKHNPALAAIAADEELRAQPVPNWGENNFYTWAQVAEKNVGKWNTVLEKADDPAAAGAEAEGAK